MLCVSIFKVYFRSRLPVHIVTGNKFLKSLQPPCANLNLGKQNLELTYLEVLVF